MSRPIASFESNKTALNKLKRYYRELGKNVVKEITYDLKNRFDKGFREILYKYYGNYDPIEYERTGILLRKSYKIDRQAQGNYGHITLYYQPKVMQYFYNQYRDTRNSKGKLYDVPNAEYVLKSFDAGWHGPSWAGIKDPEVYPEDDVPEMGERWVKAICSDSGRTAITKRAGKKCLCK